MVGNILQIRVSETTASLVAAQLSVQQQEQDFQTMRSQFEAQTTNFANAQAQGIADKQQLQSELADARSEGEQMSARCDEQASQVASLMTQFTESQATAETHQVCMWL